jgi:uncharacterized protein
MNLIWVAIALIIMLIGLVGTVLPFLPGIILVYAGYLIYGFATGWKAYGAVTMVGWGIITGLVLLLDFYAGTLGAKRYGASRYGVWGSLIGGLAGGVTAGLPGLILGPFIGAIAGELWAGGSGREALRSARGSLVGFVAGSLVKVAVGIVMIGTFLWLVLSR